PAGRIRAGQAQVGVHHPDPLPVPPQRDRPPGQLILAFQALGIGPRLGQRALPDINQAQALPVRSRDLRDVGHDGTSPELSAAPTTDLAAPLASGPSPPPRACSGRPSPRPAEPSWPANKASCRAGAILTTRMGSPLPVRLPRSGTR